MNRIRKATTCRCCWNLPNSPVMLVTTTRTIPSWKRTTVQYEWKTGNTHSRLHSFPPDSSWDNTSPNHFHTYPTNTTTSKTETEPPLSRYNFVHQIQRSLQDKILQPLWNENTVKNQNENKIPTCIIFLLAVSGGSDSIALFHTMRHLLTRTLTRTPSSFHPMESVLSNSSFRLFFPISLTPDTKTDRKTDTHTDTCTHTYIPCSLHVVHFDHGQRGQESDQDRIFVQELCSTHSIPFFHFSWNSQNLQIPFTQESAREWRQFQSFQLLQKLIHQQQQQQEQEQEQEQEKLQYEKEQQEQQYEKQPSEKQPSEKQPSEKLQYEKQPSEKQPSEKQHDSKWMGGILCTAHHKDDAEETLLMKLLRGVHLTHLSGMDYYHLHSVSESQLEPFTPRWDHHISSFSSSSTSSSPSASSSSSTTSFSSTSSSSSPSSSFSSTSSSTSSFSSSSSSPFFMALAKPMLDVRKQDIVHFLSKEGYTWREDSSNASNKYFRNRIRHDLVPLLRDLVGGTDILQKRLENLQIQSEKMKWDWENRIPMYFHSQDSISTFKTTLASNSTLSIASSQPTTTRTIPNLFPLPTHNGPFEPLEEYALHRWVQHRSNHRLILSYDKLLSICKQCFDFPDRNVWTLNVGLKWDIVRRGHVLDLYWNGEPWKNMETQWKQQDSTSTWKITQLNHTLLPHEQESREAVVRLHVKIPTLWIQQDITLDDFVVTFLSNMQDFKSFRPPWKLQGNPMKLKDFLRGQKIPLHLRNMTPILCFKRYRSDYENDDDTSPMLVPVAVYVGQNHTQSEEHKKNIHLQGGWIINSDFNNVPTDLSYQKLCISLVNIDTPD